MKITLNPQKLNLQKLLTKESLLTLLLVIIAILCVKAMLPVRVDHNVTLVISKNRAAIHNLHQQRNIETTKTVGVDILNLAEKSRFMHPRLGEIGFGQNFFVDIDTQFVIRRAGTYRFVVASDDGFALQINGQELCSHVRDRPLTSQTCTVRLDEGEHNFKLSYFQGGGHAGLSVRYGLQGERKLYWFGENSSYLRIKQ